LKYRGKCIALKRKVVNFSAQKASKARSTLQW
jgi:hypothetical protein